MFKHASIRVRIDRLTTVAALLAASATCFAQANPNKTVNKTDASIGTMQPMESTTANVRTQSVTGSSLTSPSAATTAGQSVNPSAGSNGFVFAALVSELTGTVEYAVGDADPLDLNAWKPVKNGMKLGPNTQIRTGMRSSCTLEFGDKDNLTVIQLRRGTSAKLIDFQRTANEQRVRMGLGYGAVRGGSSEGTLRSDVVVDSSVATLAKRGTEGWEIEIEPVSGTFRISLSRSGLVEAISREQEERRGVAPGEYATNSNIARMWVNQALFDRAVGPYEFQSLTQADTSFLIHSTTGLSSLGPAGGQLFGLDGRPRGQQSLFGLSNLRTLPTMIIQRSATTRPEGNFGLGPTFRVSVPKRALAAARSAVARSVGRGNR